MRRKLLVAGILFLVLFPPFINIASVFYRGDWAVFNLFFGLALLAVNLFVWRKSLYAIWLGLPLRMTGNYWPGEKEVWQMRRRPAAGYFLRAMELTLARRFEMAMNVRFLADTVQEMILLQTQVRVDPGLLHGRRWRKAAPKFEKFLESYFQGFGYGHPTHMKSALALWDSSDFDDRYLRYMAALGADDAKKMMAEDMPLDYAIAMRVER